MAKKVNSNNAALFLESGIDIKNRVVVESGDVGKAMYDRIRNAVLVLNAHGKRKTITLILSTFGGDPYYALAIYDLLVAANTRIIVNGPCMSAGIIILMAAKERMATPNSYLMIHEGYESHNGEALTVKRTREHLMQMSERVNAMIAERCAVGISLVDKWSERDTYFTAEEAKLNGLIDEVTRAKNK